MSDEFDGVGGAYIVRDGKRVQVEAPTKDHPEGNRARDKDGKPLDGATEDKPAAPAAANVKPIRGAKPAPVEE